MLHQDTAVGVSPTTLAKVPNFKTCPRIIMMEVGGGGGSVINRRANGQAVTCCTESRGVQQVHRKAGRCKSILKLLCIPLRTSCAQPPANFVEARYLSAPTWFVVFDVLNKLMYNDCRCCFVPLRRTARSSFWASKSNQIDRQHTRPLAAVLVFAL